jgi:hypothetical protein
MDEDGNKISLIDSKTKAVFLNWDHVCPPFISEIDLKSC